MWDDAVAGEQFRLDQARTLIATVKVIFRKGNRTVASVAYVHQPRASFQSYLAVAEIDGAPTATDVVVVELGRLRAQMKRLREIADALDLVDKVEALLEGPRGLWAIENLDDDQLSDALQ